MSRLFRRLGARRVPGAAALADAELSVVLTTDARIRAVNRRWRGKDRPTDVLSFPQMTVKELLRLGVQARSGRRSPWCLGDVVISLERAKEQAVEHGRTYRQELRALLVHGVVHLLGYDHEISPREERRMRRLERALLTR
ncbi:MAG: rRNA maturation RNase YbeY [Bdellovibrionales bacterium]|nr:rRNA maturation RNase YbeY [Bdellovibrionales bacterium]